jgi:superfamily I DNA/RNA helicase
MSNLSLTPTKHLNATQQQQTIIDSTNPTVLVNAVAGSGKTATLMMLANKYEKGIYLAFNKAIVKEVIPKLPMGWQCKTFNAFGLGIVKKHYPNSSVNFNKYVSKISGPASALATKHMCMNGNISMSSWESTCKHFTINNSHIIDAMKILKKGKANTSMISGEDMLQYPIDNGWKSDEFDIVLVDECQDLNPQQIAFLSCIPTKRIIFVGDAHQAIYGFRGSDPFALTKIRDMYDPFEYDMTQSFRCPKEVLKTVSRIVPNIFSTKEHGTVKHVDIHGVVFPGDCFIISRTNSSLIKLAYNFIKKNEHFSIGSAFITQVKRDLNKAFSTAESLHDVNINLQEAYEKELNKARRQQWSISNIEDKYTGLLAIVKLADSAEDIKKFVKNLAMHSNSASQRKLMTIHAAKGLENNDVYFINPGACEHFKKQTESAWEKQQEDNLYYVACTRALQNLTFVEKWKN